MSKYIIELKDDVQVVQKVGVTENGNAFVMNFYKDQLEELTADYINEHFGDLQDTAYQKGFEDGKAVNDIEKAFPIEWNNGGFNALINLQPQEAIAKLKSYEEKQKAEYEIKVGDEVKPFYTDITGVVTLIDGDTIYVLWRDGSSTSTLKLKEVTKTGRHFDIASILEAMKA